MLRYSLKFLFAVVSVSSFGLGVLFSMPQQLATTAASVFSVIVIPVLAAGAVYCIGYTRAFCFGALLPIGLLWLLVVLENQFAVSLLLALMDVYSFDATIERAAAFSFTCGIALCGVGGIVMRWYGLRQRATGALRFATSQSAA